MKPNLARLRTLCPDTDERIIREHLSRLEDRYFEYFPEDRVAEHLRALGRLSGEHPVRMLLQPRERNIVELTVLAFDYPGEFSLITGILAASGFNIVSGEVYTYSRYQPESAASPAGARRGTYGSRLRRSRTIRSDPVHRRRIIDHFSGTVDSRLSPEMWETRLQASLSETIGLLERGDSESLQQARQQVNEQVAQYLSSVQLPAEAVLYPVQIEVSRHRRDSAGITVVAQDTPFFLYALSTALALRSIFIESIRIRTVENRIEDEFTFLDAQGKRITDAERLDQVRFSVLLTKQFTYFLSGAPDPYAALCRFEQLVEKVLELPEQGRWADLLSNPLILRELARLLGASDYLWEDFIRLQYETLLPMLEPHLGGQSFATPAGDLSDRLDQALGSAKSIQKKLRILNEFKDREIFLLELDHIVSSDGGFRPLSEGLTRLAEVVVNRAAGLIGERLVRRYGQPLTVAGLPARFCVLGLGKLGGGDLGYASDIELLFVYSDNGATAGRQSIPNAEFYDHLVRQIRTSIRAKKQGIFEVDLRLRPYGASGPMACSLESFCRYYGPGGEAHPLERLALARLRAIGADVALGRQVERLRDEMLYTGRPLDMKALMAARQRQIDDRTRRGELNAKFSPGALLDLEYAVMLLQVASGAERRQLRTPFIRDALNRLQETGLLAREETERLVDAYQFLRRLINSLRMLRGSALDLFLPGSGSDEYLHLARRMGYNAGGELTPAQKLHLDFETHTAFVRAFVEEHFGREILPVPAVGNIADLVLSDALSLEERTAILRRSGFRNPERALVNIGSLAAAGSSPISFARLAVLATDFLRSQPDPDMALNNWERFLAVMEDPEEHFRLLLSQPKRLDILLRIFAGSQYLSDALIRDPDFFEWATLPERLHNTRGREQVEELLRELSLSCASGDQWANELRRHKRREILRIGIRDICLDVPIEEIMEELSMLAEAALQVELERLLRKFEAGRIGDGFCLLAFGKLGGRELNYSSDIDLLGVSAKPLDPESELLFKRVMDDLRSDLSAHTEEGAAYRVDLRLRPFGRSGELVGSVERLVRYYREQAAIWELQALLKARPVAGNIRLGETFLGRVEALLCESRCPKQVAASLERMRMRSQGKLHQGIKTGRNIKLGSGGIRDVEFLVQGLQLVHAGRVGSAQARSKLLSGNTLAALAALRELAVLSPVASEQLRRDYLFLRRIEHYLQIFEDRQTHTLPRDSAQLQALSRRMLGPEADAALFGQRVDACMDRVHAVYRRFFEALTETAGDSYDSHHE
ncbi:MAG: glutamate-ammonia-ligase adenylyltransferase [Spirochaetales bacterium]|nr:glutamate-ammonia-ligase adenylyltransferase [Spirochaetales bacterium]